MSITKTPFRAQPAFNEVVVIDDEDTSLQVLGVAPTPTETVTLHHVLANGGSRFDLRGFLSKLLYDGRQAIPTTGFAPWAYNDGRLLVTYQVGADATPYYAVNAVQQLGESLDLLNEVKPVFLTDRAKLNETPLRMPCYDGFPVGVSMMFRSDYELDLSDAFTITAQVTATQVFKPPFLDDGNGGIILWGDGTLEASDKTAYRTHQYATAGTYTVQFLPKVFGVANCGRTNYSQFAIYRSTIRTVENFSSRIRTADFYQCTGLTAVRSQIKYPAAITEYMFYGCTSLSSLPEGLTANISATASHNAQYMFYGCTSLTTIPAGTLAGLTRIVSASRMFQGCTKLASVPAGLFATQTGTAGNASTKLDYVFSGCTSLTSIPTDLFQPFGTYITGLGYAFQGCTSLASIPADLFRYNTALTLLTATFSGCTAVTSLPQTLFRYNTAMAQFVSVFAACSGITSIPVDFFRYNTATTIFNSVFSGCTSLTALPAGLFTYNTAVTSTSYMFFGCTGLTALPSGVLNPLVNLTDASNMFSLVSFIWDGTIFTNNGNLTNVSGFNSYNTAMTAIPANTFQYTPNITRVNEFFRGWTGITAIPTGLFDPLTSQLSGSVSYLFAQCSNLVTVPSDVFSKFGNVTSLYYVFNACAALTGVPVDIFDPLANLQSASGTFSNTGITSMVAGWFANNPKLTSLDSLFASCPSLTVASKAFVDALPSSVSLFRLFYQMAKLTTVETGLLDSRTGVTTAEQLFNGCTTLTNIPRDIFRNCKGITNFSSAFYGCSGLSGQYTFKDNGLELWQRAGQPGYPTSVSGSSCYNGTGMIVEGGGSIPSGWR